MSSPQDPARLDRIREKLALLRRLEAERGLGVVIGEPTPLEPIPDLPGVAEVYGLFGHVAGDNFRFEPPDEIRTPAAWAARTVNENDPMGSPLSVGHEVHSIPPRLRGEIRAGSPIYLDTENLDVYWMEPDDYVFQYEHPDEDVEFTVIAPDVATFFDEHVFGPGYPELVATVLGPGVRDERLRRGRHAGEYADNWRRLLIAADLSS
ncbi:hypothetical protein GA0070606_3906 [Micromonospora citrea]|uniref:SUKH-4 immunity protein n=1 Tax=Micromonospora citrea TaxID=47855 RepID=A0A1C6VE16_9ACTN|nr:hypothetical protein [Micromonospora citrea]SCL64090.1 hypothetical protein GA0070606_3906 [Micromonospora citrea]